MMILNRKHKINNKATGERIAFILSKSESGKTKLKFENLEIAKIAAKIKINEKKAFARSCQLGVMVTQIERIK